MFAFASALYCRWPVIFAAEPGTLGWVLIVVAVLCGLRFCFRGPRRARRSAGTMPQACRSRRGGFPWKAAVLVILIVAAVRSYPHYSPWPAKWDFEQHVRKAQEFAHHGGFPAVESKDLWALRRAGKMRAEARRGEHEDAEHEDDPAVVLGATPTAPAADESAVAVPELPQPADPPPVAADTSASATTPHVARTIVELKKLTDRAIAQARAVYAKTGDEAAELKALAALKFVNVKSQGQPPAESTEVDTAANVAAPVATQIAATTSESAVSTPPTKTAAVESAPAAPLAEAQATPLTRVLVPAAQAAPAIPATAEKEATPVAASKPVPAEKRSPDWPFKFPSSAPPTRVPPQREKPAWLHQPAGRDGDIYYETVVAERYPTGVEAEDALAREAQERTQAYVERYLGEGTSKLFVVPPAFVHDRLIKDRYSETVETSLGPMVTSYARLGFDSRARAYLQRMQREAQAENRLLLVAGAAGGVLLVVGAVFGYLKLDTLTRGYYTGRLQFATAVVILTVAVGAFVVLSRSSTQGHVGLGMWNERPAAPLVPLKAIDLPTG